MGISLEGQIYYGIQFQQHVVEEALADADLPKDWNDTLYNPKDDIFERWESLGHDIVTFQADIEYYTFVIGTHITNLKCARMLDENKERREIMEECNALGLPFYEPRLMALNSI